MNYQRRYVIVLVNLEQGGVVPLCACGPKFAGDEKGVVMDMEEDKKPRVPEETPDTDFNFMKEKIKQRPIDKKKLIRRTAITVSMAAIFGLVACLTFFLLEPVISNWLYPEEEPKVVDFPEETVTEETRPEDMIVDDEEMEAQNEPQEVELGEEQIDQLLSRLELGAEDYLSMYESLSSIAAEVGKSIVTVTGVTSDLDWFNNPYESKEQTSGIIIEDNGKEKLVLVDSKGIKDAETILVTFHNGRQAKASIKKNNSNTHLAVLAIPLEDIDKGTLETIGTAELGSSNDLTLVGRPVIAVGSPMGTVNSICYGIITSTENPLEMIDATYRLLTTDMYGSKEASGVLVDVRNNKVIGVIDNSHNSSGAENLISAYGISDLKKIITKMSNGEDKAYLGVYGTNVTPEANETLGVPFGAYIKEIEMDSPAMGAGIQSGDIIVSAGEVPIANYDSLVSYLMERKPEEAVTFTLMRQSLGEYTTMEVSVTLGKLK